MREVSSSKRASKMDSSFSLHTRTVHRWTIAFNRIHMLLHFTAILFLLYYRTTSLFLKNNITISPFSWSLITFSELIFTFIWILTQPFRWFPVSRSVFPDNISDDVEFPGVDVFVCTADPLKEPTVKVMNTVLSCLALDYPPEKLVVYLSDDGGSSITLYAVKKAGVFAKSWVPFCNEYGIKCRSPDVYFSSLGDNDRIFRDQRFRVEEAEIKAKYEAFKSDLEIFSTEKNNCRVVRDRSARVEIILDGKSDGDSDQLPLLVYVSRERRPSFPHHYKAGNLNNLVRVSGVISNNPYLLVLDCDMNCNDPTSVKQAMCFLLDSTISNNLAFVQFPQIFYNISNNDIYDNQARPAFKTKWRGMDGLRGPVMSGSGYFLKRKALYGSPNQEEEKFDVELQKVFGQSRKFIDSLEVKREYPEDEMLKEATILASCSYEENTEWGKKIGFSYECLLESTFTGYLLQCRGWNSVYLYPKKPCFLGCSPVDMKDAMVQMLKWSSELLQVSFSKFSPLTYGVTRMSILHSMSYGYFTFSSLLSIAFVLYGVIPQWCFLRGIPLYPKLSDPWFGVFVAVFISSLFQHLIEVISSDGNLRTWWNELRIWVVKSVSAGLFGLVDAVMKITGMRKVELSLTNKAIDKEKLEKYEKGKFDLQGAAILMAPLFVMMFWNMICFLGGMRKVMIEKNYQEMFGQIFLISFAMVLHYPVLEGVMKRERKLQH